MLAIVIYWKLKNFAKKLCKVSDNFLIEQSQKETNQKKHCFCLYINVFMLLNRLNRRPKTAIHNLSMSALGHFDCSNH